MQQSLEVDHERSRTRATIAPLAKADGLPDRTISLFGLDIIDTSLEGATERLIANALDARPTQVSFLNADCVNIMHREAAYLEVLKESDCIFADGIGVRLAARFAGYRLQDNVNGTDLFPVLCRHATDAGIGIYLFGAREGRARAAGENMQKINPDLIISGSHHGYIADSAAETRLIDEINSSGARILMVALGAPAQELWIARNRHRLNPSVLLGVGGLFDYYSGSVARAPLMIRNARMEWAWRLALEPRRLARRYLIGNVEFLIRVGLQPITR